MAVSGRKSRPFLFVVQYIPMKKRETFAEKVYAVVAKIPRGKTLTYAEVARRAHNPKAYRAVGNILNKNRDPKMPCHRVVRTGGDTGGFAWGRKRKIMMLRREGAIK